jgi:hypothetical protein
MSVSASLELTELSRRRLGIDSNRQAREYVVEVGARLDAIGLGGG